MSPNVLGFLFYVQCRWAITLECSDVLHVWRCEPSAVPPSPSGSLIPTSSAAMVAYAAESGHGRVLDACSPAAPPFTFIALDAAPNRLPPSFRMRLGSGHLRVRHPVPSPIYLVTVATTLDCRLSHCPLSLADLPNSRCLIYFRQPPFSFPGTPAMSISILRAPPARPSNPPVKSS
jgi:hypothetical protein